MGVYILIFLILAYLPTVLITLHLAKHYYLTKQNEKCSVNKNKEKS